MEWKKVKGYEDCYEVSSKGDIRTIPREVQTRNHPRMVPERILKPQQDKDGYLMVCLSKNNIKTSKKIHRLVAEAFLENPNGYSSINHKDENKRNNSVDNLEWCSSLYNTRYGTGIERRTAKRRKAVVALNSNGDSFYFTSITEASKKLGISHSCIIACLNGKQKTSGGYIWKSNQ